MPPDTEIIKYTSSIVGPKVPGTTNRGRKKTISLDPPSVSVVASHSSTGMLIDRGGKRLKPQVNIIYKFFSYFETVEGSYSHRSLANFLSSLKKFLYEL